MEPETSIPPELNSDPDASLTLDQAREKLRALLLDAERNAWEIGHLLNTIENRLLVWRAGYRITKKWLQAAVPEAKGKTSTLYRYANVASQYTKAHVQRWGIAKLYCLMLHDGETCDVRLRGDPAEREIQLFQQDGSILLKKFRDCSCRELRLSSRRRKGPTEPEPDILHEGEGLICPQDPAVASAQSMDFLREQLASAARRSQSLFWPFTRARAERSDKG